MKKPFLLLLSSIAIFTLFRINALYSQEIGWEKLATLENPPGFGALAAVNGKLYVVSGTTSANSPTYEYDPATNTWTTRAPIPQACFWSTATVINNLIFVMGGRIPQQPQSYNYIYDTDVNTWVRGADLLTPRNYHSAVAANGKVYLMGGQNGDGTSEWYFDEYDPSSNQWTRKAQMAHNGAWYCAAAELNGKVYRIAGGGYTSVLSRDYFDVYDPATDKWANLPNFRVKLHAPSCVTYNNKIYVFGGISSDQTIDSIYIYSEGEEWIVSTVHLPQPRVYHKTVLIGDCVYLYGGQNDTKEFKGELYRYCFKELDVTDNPEPTLSVVAPNPNNGDFRIMLNEVATDALNISVTDMLGQSVSFQSAALGQALSVSINERTAGVYYVRVQNGSNVYCEKVVIR